MRFILFDLYETLISFHQEPVRDARVTFARQVGIPSDALNVAAEQTLRERMCGGYGPRLDDELRAILREAGEEPDADLLRAFRQIEIEAWSSATINYDDVVRGLKCLRGADWRLALVSNCSHLTRPLLFDHWGLGELFDTIVLSCEVGQLKPELPIWRRAVEELERASAGGNGASRVGVVVDDREAYVAAAASGLGLLGYRMERNGARRAGGHRGIGDLTELCDLLGVGGGPHRNRWSAEAVAHHRAR